MPVSLGALQARKIGDEIVELRGREDPAPLKPGHYASAGFFFNSARSAFRNEWKLPCASLITMWNGTLGRAGAIAAMPGLGDDMHIQKIELAPAFQKNMRLR